MNQTVTDTINNPNLRNKEILISMFDFSILHANIPHHKLKLVMKELINVCFNSGNMEFTEIVRYGATCTNCRQK